MDYLFKLWVGACELNVHNCCNYGFRDVFGGLTLLHHRIYAPLNWVIISSDNGLSSVQHQTIIKTIDDSYQSYLKYQTSMRAFSKLANFH